MIAMTVKRKIVKEAERHERLDAFVKGTYESRNGVIKHCSIGCVRAALGLDASIGEHGQLVDPTGVPEFILRLSDNIFEGLPESASKRWTRRLWSAIPANTDLMPVVHRMNAWLAGELARTAIRADVRECARRIKEMYLRRANGDEPKDAEWKVIEQHAYAAWRQADAARRQADAAWQQAYAAWRQADAARRQADAAWQQAYAAWQQADAARRQADAARRQAYAAAKKFWTRCADALIRELKKAA